jgi:hypothetical protein
MAVRPEASIPSVTSSAVEYHEKPDPPFLKKGHMELSSLSLSLDSNLLWVATCE